MELNLMVTVKRIFDYGYGREVVGDDHGSKSM